MKKTLILVFVLILLAFSCSTTPPTVKEGAKLFNEQKYAEAIKVFEKVLEKDPENANAAYNIAISYIQLKDDDTALNYLDKTIKINKFYYDAWHNMAVINYNKGNYKEAVKHALKSAGLANNIKINAYKKLAEQGFLYRDYANPIAKETNIPEPEIKHSRMYLCYTLSISKEGKVNEVNCGKKGDEKICEFYTPFLSSLEFIPAYDFEKNEVKESVQTGFLAFRENEKVANTINDLENETPTPTKTKNTPESVTNVSQNQNKKTSLIMGAIDRKDIDLIVRENLVDFRNCYEYELKKNRNLVGRIVVNFTIDQDGSVPVAKINRSTMNNEIVEKCVVKVTKKLQFPAPRGGGIVIVNYPFVFKHSSNK